MEKINPRIVAPPLSRYSHGIVVPAGGRRLVISGQVGISPDGTVPEDLRGQLEQIWENILAVLDAAGMTKFDLVKVTSFATAPDVVGLFREVREAVLEGHEPASTYLVVAGLAAPRFLAEIEAEAVSAD